MSPDSMLLPGSKTRRWINRSQLAVLCWFPRCAIAALLLLHLSVSGKAHAHPWGGLVVDRHERIFFTFVCPMVGEQHAACVWEFDPDRPPRAALESASSPSDIVLARSPGGTVYAAERLAAGATHQAGLWRLATPGGWSAVIPMTSDPRVFHVQAYAVDDSGNLYFARDARLFMRAPNGSVSSVQIDAPLDRIDALVWGQDRKLYLLDRGRLYVRQPDGRLRTRATGLKQEDPEHLPFSGANILFDLAVDEDGAAYLAYYGNRRVLRVSPSGKVTTALDAQAPWSPHGVDVHDGSVYVLESTIRRAAWWRFWQRPEIVPRVRALRPDGSVTTLFEYGATE